MQNNKMALLRRRTEGSMYLMKYIQARNPLIAEQPHMTIQYVEHLTPLFFAEIYASALLTFPCMLIDETAQYGPICKAIAIGFFAYVAIWSTYPISGAHLNPIVTLATVLNRSVPLHHLPVYWSGQAVGTAASLNLAAWLNPKTKSDPYYGMTMPHKDINDGQAIGVEIVIAYLLILVILSSQDEFRTEVWTVGNGINVSIATMTIYIGTSVVSIPVTGASMNPFRSLIAAAIKGQFKQQYCYIVGPLLGCLIAVVTYETFMTSNACWSRTRAWLTRSSFDRDFDYKRIRTLSILQDYWGSAFDISKLGAIIAELKETEHLD